MSKSLLKWICKERDLKVYLKFFKEGVDRDGFQNICVEMTVVIDNGSLKCIDDTLMNTSKEIKKKLIVHDYISESNLVKRLENEYIDILSSLNK